MDMITSEEHNSFIGESKAPGIPLASQFPHLITNPAENTKNLSKNSWKAFVRKCWAGLFSQKNLAGSENTSQNTTSSSTSNTAKTDTMKSITEDMPIFQWIRGEKMGTIVKSTGETVIDGDLEFMLFEDGSQCNTQFIGEWIVPIHSIADAPYMEDPQPTPVAIQKVIPPPMAVAARDNPIHNLLDMSKKKTMKMQITVSVDMPSEDLIKVIHESYENGLASIGNYLVSTIDQASIMKQVDTMLRAKVDDVTRKKRIKNEANI